MVKFVIVSGISALFVERKMIGDNGKKKKKKKQKEERNEEREKGSIAL